VNTGRKEIAQIDDVVAGQCEQNGFRYENGGFKDVVERDLDHEGDHAFGEGDESDQDNTKSQPDGIWADVAQESFQLW
jgi:hypothetical protein